MSTSNNPVGVPNVADAINTPPSPGVLGGPNTSGGSNPYTQPTARAGLNQIITGSRGVEGALGTASKALGMKKGGKVSSASKRADGIAQRGKTRGKMV